MALVRPITGAGTLAAALLLTVASPAAADADPPADPTVLTLAEPATAQDDDRDDNGDDRTDDDPSGGGGLWDDEPRDPDHERGEVFLELSPSTVPAGHEVEIRAGCGDDLKPAKVRSRAFDDLELIRRDGTKLFTGVTTVPTDTRPGDYRVRLRCDNGAGASAELHVLDMSRPSRGPDTGGGATATGVDPAGTRTAGLTTPPVLLAVGLVAAAAGAVLLGHRRRPR